jgi:hypothetical protein
VVVTGEIRLSLKSSERVPAFLTSVESGDQATVSYWQKGSMLLILFVSINDEGKKKKKKMEHQTQNQLTIK